MFERLAQYPVEMLNWHDRLTEPKLNQASTIFPGLLVGGIEEHGTLIHGSEQEIVHEVRDALDQTRGRRLMIAPGCVLPVCVTDEQISTATRAAHEYNV